jgi:N-methylhydantoinase B
MPDLDILAVEIHRKALENVVNEMGTTLVRTSGSPIVTDAHDYSTCLHDVNGEQLAIVADVLVHTASSMLATKAIVEQLRSRGQSPRPGDGWLCNDPYCGGAMHQADIGVVMPIFFDARHIGWAFSNVHVLDVGGVGVSGFAPGAHSVFEEGIRFPLVRAIANGQLEDSWAEYIAANVRVPGPVLNDIRGMIAANNVAQKKVEEVVRRFGLERHLAFCELNQELSERLMRERIAKIPDGTYEGMDWTEFDGHDGPDRLLEVRCRMTVSGSDVTFRFDGAPQLDAFVNSQIGGVSGNVMTGILTMLGYGDLPFNAGIWRPITIDLGPPGTIVHAQSPGPVSATHAETGAKVVRVVKGVLADALSRSEDPVLRSRVAGQGFDGAPMVGQAGVNQYGGPTVAWYMDTSVGSGGGAQSFMDGQDCYGGTCMAGCRLADVETHEAMDPVLFLWRRLLPNSGGAGQHRGGQGIDMAYAIAYTDQMTGFISTICAQAPSRGFGGGWPGGAGAIRPIIDTNLTELMAAGTQPVATAIQGKTLNMKNKVGHFTSERGDVIHFISGGGGGVGDPLLRPAELVLQDVRDGYITLDHAYAAYGVVADTAGERLDDAATQRRRAAIRAGRIGCEPPSALVAPAEGGVSVRFEPGGASSCGYCGARLASGSADWRESDAVTKRITPVAAALGDASVHVRDRLESPRVMMAELFCRSCAGCLRVEVTTSGENLHGAILESDAPETTIGA